MNISTIVLLNFNHRRVLLSYHNVNFCISWLSVSAEQIFFGITKHKSLSVLQVSRITTFFLLYNEFPICIN